MKQPSLLFLAAVISHARILPRDLVVVDSFGSCPTVTVQLQPVQYCEDFTFNTVIGPINDKGSLATANLRTDVCTTGFTTTTIYPDTRPGCSSCAGTSVSASSSPSSIKAEATESLTVITTAASNGAPTISTSAPATTTGEPELFFGEGLPSGTVSDLPDSPFLFLAFKNVRATALLAKRDNHGEKQIRQVGSDTVSPVALVNLGVGLPGGLSQDDCDNSSPLLLRAGSLIQYDRAVAKEQFQSNAQFGFLVDPINPVNTTFTLANGFLQWITPDLGAAIYYDCGGSIFAAFGGPLVDCTEVSVGAIAGAVCIDRVRQTRTPNPNFIAPVPTTSSTTTTTVAPISATSEASQTTSTAGSSLVLLPTTTPQTTTSIMPVSLSSEAISSISSTKSIPSTSSLLATALPITASSSDISSSPASSIRSTSDSTSFGRSGSSSRSSSPSFTDISTSFSRSVSKSSSRSSSSHSSTHSSTTVDRSTTQTTSSSSSASASPTTCQNLPDPYTAPNGKQFSTDCTYTYYSNDIYKTVYASSFAECMDDCSTDVHSPPCVAVSFGFPNGCFLLNNTEYFGFSDPSKYVSARLLQ